MTLFAVALTLYFVGSSALNLISSLLPIPIPVECILIGLFMGMFPRRTATIFYAVTCGLLVIGTIVSIPNLMITAQSMINLGLGFEKNPIEAPIANSFTLGIIFVVLIVFALIRYRMEAVKMFFEVMLKVILITAYICAPMAVFIFVVFGINGVPFDKVLNVPPLLFVYPLVLWEIYITVTGPLVARWVFRRIGIYRRIPKIWQG